MYPLDLGLKLLVTALPAALVGKCMTTNHVTGALGRPLAPPSNTSDSPQTPSRRDSLDTRPPSCPPDDSLKPHLGAAG